MEQTTQNKYPDKYIHVRQHDPAHFSGYETRAIAGTDFAPGGEMDGIKVSLGTWAKTGAKVIQKFLFDKDAGWTNERVKTWFAEHPQFQLIRSLDEIFDDMADTVIPEHDSQADEPSSSEAIAVQSVLIDTPCVMDAALGAEFSVLKVHVIREGWGKNRRLSPDGIQACDYFTKEFLRSLLPMLENSAVQAVKLTAKQDADGPAPLRLPALVEELQRHGHPPTVVNILFDQGFVGNTVGFLRNVEYVENAVIDEAGTPRDVLVAEFHVADTDAVKPTRQLISYAWSHGFQKALGLSINYRANAQFTQVDGRPAFRFDTATHHVSTELVPNPAAHGGIVSVIQSMGDTNTAPKTDTMSPDAAEATKETQTAPAQKETSGAQQTHDQTPSGQTAPTDAEQSTETPEPTAAEPSEEVNAMQNEISELKEMVTGLTDSLKIVTGAVGEIQKDKQQQALEAIVTQSTLDAADKADILSGIASGEYVTHLDVTRAVKLVQTAQERAVAAVQSQMGAPVFPGMGHLPATVTKDPSDVNNIRSKLLWGSPMTQSEQDMATKYGIGRFMGVQDEYKTITGDTGLNFRFDQAGFERNIGAFAQATSMTTLTYPEFLRNVLIGRAEIHWKAQNKDHLKVVKVGEPFTDTKPEDEFVLGQISDIPIVLEDGAYNELSAAHKETIRSEAVKRGGILSFSEETILNDRTDLVKQSVDLLIAAMNRTEAKGVWKMQAGYNTAFNDEQLGDGVGGAGTDYLYSAARSNYINGAISIANIQNLVNLLLTQTDIAEVEGEGEGIVLMPKVAVCNVINTGVVRRILNGDYEVNSTDVSTALNLGFSEEQIVGIHPSYLYGKPGAVFLYPDPADFAGMEIRHFRGKSTPDLVWEGNQQPAHGYTFANDRMLLKLKKRTRLVRKRKKAFHALFPAV